MLANFTKKQYAGLMGAALSLALLVTAACGDIDIDFGDRDEPAEISSESFDVGSSPKLVVDTFNGRIVVNAGADESMQVEATLRMSDKIDYQTRLDGNTLIVEAKEIGRTIGRSPGADIEITVPSSTIVDLRTSNGKIEVSGIQQAGILRTSNGKIIVNDGTGDLRATTSNGSISVSAFEGSADLHTSNGSISFDGELTRDGRSEMSTSNGGIDVALRGTPSVQLDASASNGATTSRLPILATSTGKSHLIDRIGDGDAELKIRTSNGAIVVQ